MSEFIGFGNCGALSTSCATQRYTSMQVPIWDSVGCDGDNVFRLYDKDAIVAHDGAYWVSLVANNKDKPDEWSAAWSGPKTLLDLLGSGGGATDCLGMKGVDFTCLPVEAPIPVGGGSLTCADLMAMDLSCIPVL